MNTLLVEALPELAHAAAAALRSEGYATAAAQLSSAVIERCTYDPSVNAGYVYLWQSDPIHAGETPAAETVAFAAPHWFNIDLRASGSLFGIELLSPTQSFVALAKKIP
jgi:hypothetical protein